MSVRTPSPRWLVWLGLVAYVICGFYVLLDWALSDGLEPEGASEASSAAAVFVVFGLVAAVWAMIANRKAVLLPIGILAGAGLIIALTLTGG